MWTKTDRRHALGGAARHQCLLLAIAALFVLPLVWAVSMSLRSPGLPPPRGIEVFPRPAAWGNYIEIFRVVPLGRYLLNSLLVVSLAVPLTIVTASCAGLAMAQLGPAARRRLLVLAVLVLMVPATAVWLTRFVLFSYLGLIDSIWALVAPAFMGSSPFFVLLFYWAFRRVPSDLFDSARVDGAGALRLWWTIAMPLARRTTVAVAVLSFSLYWSDFISPLLYLKSEDRYTLPVGLQLFQQMDRTNSPLVMAAAVTMTLPVVLLFLACQRYLWPEPHAHFADGPGTSTGAREQSDATRDVRDRRSRP